MVDLFKVGDWVFDIDKKRAMKIIDVFELWGYVSYSIYDPIEKVTYTVSDKRLVSTEKKNDFDLNYFKYVIIASRISNELAQGFLSSISGSIIPLPHQIYALNRALSKSTVRYLLADEVGLGKTIEAGLIIKELKARGLAKRILIISPKGLITQWHDELELKFNEDFKIILPQDFEVLKRIYGEGNIWDKFPQVITSLDSVKPVEKRQGWTKERIKEFNKERMENLVMAGWDIIVVDEAHRLAGSSSDVARHKLGIELSKASPYLLLLTATPHQGKTDSFLRLMRLIDKEAFPNEKAIVREQVAPYIIRTEKREAVDRDGNPLFKKRITKTVNISWEIKHSLQRELYEKVTKYVAEGYNRAKKEKRYYIGFLMVLMQRLVTSSTHAIKVNLENRLEFLKNEVVGIESIEEDMFFEYDAQKVLDELLKIKSIDIKKEIDELEELLRLAKQAESQYIDAKAEVLIDFIDQLSMEYKNSQKFIVFTEFLATQQYLKDFLESKGYKVAILNGSMSMEERDASLKEFKNYKDVLISTDAGGEGLNLQFCNIVINYDLPWNPMKIEQRIGRVDRIGQERDVLVLNFMLEDTIEFRVREVLEEKLRMIYEQFGVDKMGDILDSVQSEMDFTELYMRSIEMPEGIEYNVSIMEDKIKEKTEQINRIKGLLREEKELDLNIVSKISGLPINEWIRDMYINKMAAEGVEISIDMLDENLISLNNEEIKNMIKNLPVYIKSSKIPILYLKDVSNEEGYWSLWEISINGDSEKFKHVFPVFLNKDKKVRIASANLIWDIFLKNEKEVIFKGYKSIDEEMYDFIHDTAKNMAYDYFEKIKKNYFENLVKEKERYEYAFKLRKEAILRIGLEAVRRRRLVELENEERRWKEEIEKSMDILPMLKPLYIVYLE